MTRSGRNLTANPPPPTCKHCGEPGHISTICPRSTYNPDNPALTCRNCIRTIRSGYSDEPSGHDMVAVIGACNVHASPVIRPQRPPSAQPPPVPRPPPPPPPVLAAAAPVMAPPVPVTPRSAVLTAPAPAPPVPAPVPAPAPAPAPPVPASAAPVPAPTQPVPVPVPAPGPTRRTRCRTFSLPSIILDYDRIVTAVNSGTSLPDALTAASVSRTHFNRRRVIAEAAKVDLHAVQNAITALRKVTLENLAPTAKLICNRKLSSLRTLHAQGTVLHPKDQY